MKKKSIILLSVLLLMLFTFTACNKSTNKDNNQPDTLHKVRVVLDWTPNTNHTGIYVAKEKGFFEKEGLEVEILQPPEDGAELLVASGGAEFGISFQDYMTFALATEDPLPITAIAAIIQHNTSGIISLKEREIDSPDKMAGHTYATWDMPIEKAIIKKIVEDYKGNYEEIEFVPSTVTDVVTALKTEIDSVWVYYAWDGIATKVAGLETNFLNFADYGRELDFYSPVIISNNEYLEESPEIVKSFLKAVRDGYELSIENPEEAADILYKAVPELDLEILKASQEWLAQKYKEDVNQWGYIDQSRWDAFYNWLFEEEIIDIKIPSAYGFTNEFLPE